MRLTLGNTKTGFPGFLELITLFQRIKDAEDDVLDIDMASVDWIDANMCSPLGAILSWKKKPGRKIQLSNLRPRQHDILARNHFLSEFGEVRDIHETTIEFRHFECSTAGAGDFQTYVSAYFRQGSKGLPVMSDPLLKKFRESLHEIFENAREHSASQDRIFACGQLFPRQNRLDFTITDLGIGIDGSIRKMLGLELSSDKAIEWAVSGKTTRSGRPGGLGLQLLREFIGHNNGRMIIVSGKAYWQVAQRAVSGQLLQVAFPGTSVTIEVNTADPSSYCLTSEIDPASIF